MSNLEEVISWLVAWLTMYDVKFLGLISLGEMGEGVVIIRSSRVCRHWVQKGISTILRRQDLRALRERKECLVGGPDGIALPAYFAGAFKGMCGELPDGETVGYPFDFVVCSVHWILAEVELERLYLTQLQFDNKTRAFAFIGRKRLGRTPDVVYRAGVLTLAIDQYRNFQQVALGQFAPDNMDAVDRLLEAIGEDPQTGIGPSALRSMMTSAFRGTTCHSRIIV